MNKKYLAFLAAGILTVAGCSSAAPAASSAASSAGSAEGSAAPEDTSSYAVQMYATVTDAGQYIDKMVIDFGDEKISGLENDTFEVHMTSTVDYGEEKGNPYAYYDASAPLQVVKTETDGGKAIVYCCGRSFSAA